MSTIVCITVICRPYLQSSLYPVLSSAILAICPLLCSLHYICLVLCSPHYILSCAVQFFLYQHCTGQHYITHLHLLIMVRSIGVFKTLVVTREFGKNWPKNVIFGGGFSIFNLYHSPLFYVQFTTFKHLFSII